MEKVGVGFRIFIRDELEWSISPSVIIGTSDFFAVSLAVVVFIIERYG